MNSKFNKQLYIQFLFIKINHKTKHSPSFFMSNKDPLIKTERNRKLQLQTTLITIQIRSFLVLLLKSLNYTTILIPSRKKCKQLPNVTNFVIEGFFQGEYKGDEYYFESICDSIQQSLKKQKRDYVVKRYADFKMNEMIIQFLQMSSIQLKETYKKSEVKLGSIVRIQRIDISDELKNFILEKLKMYFTEEHQSLQLELENGVLTDKNIELLGELFYHNELKQYIEMNKKLNGLHCFVY